MAGGRHHARFIVEKVTKAFTARGGQYSTADQIAAEIYNTAIDPGFRVLLVAGKAGRNLNRMTRLLSEGLYQRMIQRSFKI